MKRIRPTTRLCYSVVLGLAVFLPACGRTASDGPSSPVTFYGKTMGTSYTVKLARPPAGLDVDLLEGDVRNELEKIDALMSTYRPDSELSRLNRCESGMWFPVSSETAAVIDEALQIGRLTGGAFDVTVGPLVNLWNFGPEKDAVAKIPSAEEVEKVKSRVGYQHVEVRTSPPAVRKDREGLYIDLSGIAKGYAVDRLAALLEQRGVDHFMVEIGGEVKVKGLNFQGEPWQIGVAAPTAGVPSVRRIVPLEDLAMATSGDYQNFFERDGTRYSHIIDPRSAAPIAHPMGSATVLGPSCARADALATALMVLGPEEGYNLAVRENLPVLLIINAEEGFVEKATPGFPQPPQPE